ncbi:MAG: DUF3201 domain-containing protein [Alphaproteobacteria bacterium]|jgi:hypothetical protein|nr:DUF3201 domain-containing protein [Alphaproteobacteria bacterium]
MDKISIIHNHFNNIYKIANNIENILKEKNIKFKKGNYTNHYISINNKFKLQKYYIPVFTIKNTGDIGINIDKIFFEIPIKKSKLNTNKIKKIVEQFPKIEIYGYKNCLNDFYKNNDIEKLLLNIKNSHEKFIQFNLESEISTKANDIVNKFNSLSILIKT